MRVDQDGIVYILTSAGLARLFSDRIALDSSYRPLAKKIPNDIAVAEGELYSLYPDEVLSNRRAGTFVRKLPSNFSHLAVGPNAEVLLADRRTVVLLNADRTFTLPLNVDQVIAGPDGFLVRCGDTVFRVEPGTPKMSHIKGLRTIATHREKVLAGTTNGYARIDGDRVDVLNRLPSTNIHAFASSSGAIWAATTRGVWSTSGDGTYRYFASRRWLDDDDVVDIAVAPAGDVYALTQTGLNRIEFRPMTLEEKAMHYERKIRQRHIRYGFCAELRLRVPGDITSAEMIDTDNDGTWSNYYMASQAFRFGATGDPQARRNAWETFEALERLEAINPLDGFPSRTFERTGFKVSDPDRWYEVGDDIWDWKAHTSSDEIAAHAFGSAVLYETAANDAEKQRIARFIGKIVDHIIRNNWYLIDKDGKPTLWARWNPEYVNWFPETIVDRRLNSSEIIALLQFAYAITGRELYREKAFELIENHGYLNNIVTPMARIAETKGYLHQGIDMGNEWNHSDDLLSFITYWVLHRFAFTDDLRAKYAAAIRDHFEIERIEQCPIWNFVYASTGAREFGLDEALWTLRGFPLDMTDWTVVNSHRQDITRLEPNFRNQQLKELLRPDERRITRWNGHPFNLDGGSGGHLELAGDEYLLPYWMARYLKLIQPPGTGGR